MAGLSRKELKQDKFVNEVGQGVRFFQKHRNPLIAAAVLVVAGIVGGTAWYNSRQASEAEARMALQDAIRLYHGTVTTEQRPGIVTFATTGERLRRSTEAFEQIKVDHAGSDLAVAADYYLALLEVEDNKNDEARTRLQNLVSSNSRGNYAGLARLTLAQMLGREGKVDEARSEFEALIANPTAVVPASRAKLELGRMLADHDPEAARPIFQELADVQGPVSAAASLALSRLPQGS